jgi:hypothetical protein
MVAGFVELAAMQLQPKGSTTPPPDGWAFPAAIKRRLQVGACCARDGPAPQFRCPVSCASRTHLQTPT